MTAGSADPLASTLVLAGGCTAAKVGPNQLLVAARCVADNAAFKPGATIKFTVAATIAKKAAAKTDGGGVTPKTMTLTQGLDADPEGIFENELYPLVEPTCSGCHATGAGGAPVYFGADAKSSYPLFKARSFQLASGPYLTKGKHEGPALTADQQAAAQKWIAAEAAAADPPPAAAANANDPDAAAADPGDPADPGDAGSTKPSKPPNKSTTQAKIQSVYVHESFVAKCTNVDAGTQTAACDFGAIGASDARDVAVIILDAELVGVPTIPVDLDTVGQSDPLRAVASGCPTFDGTAGTVRQVLTMAVPAKSANYTGSPYATQPALNSRLGSAYVVTPGAGWKNGMPDPICKTDIGAPLFRGNVAAVAGVTSNFTTVGGASTTPVTVFHTKIDTASKVGTWLGKLGVTTTHSCGTGGCPKHGYDGGLPPVENGGVTSEPDDAPDAGKTDAAAPSGTKDGGTKDAGKSDDGDDDSTADGFPQPDSDFGSGDDGTEGDGADDDAGAEATPKKKAAASSCSAAPGSSSSAGDAGLGFGILGLALGAARIRRRRAPKR